METLLAKEKAIIDSMPPIPKVVKISDDEKELEEEKVSQYVLGMRQDMAQIVEELCQ